MTEATSSRKTFWSTLFGPHPKVMGWRGRQRARLLAAITLGLFVVTAPLLLTGLIPSGERATAGATVALFLVAYALSRTRWPQWGAALLVAGLIAIPFGSILLVFRDPAAAARAELFLLLPILLAALLLEARAATALNGLTVLGLVAALVFVPWLTREHAMMPLVVITLATVLASIGGFIQEADVQTIQKQAGELDVYSQSLKDEIERIMTTAEVGRVIAGARELEALLNQVVNLIIERFEFYHAQVFLVDEAGQYAVLRESTGTAGEELLARGHRLAVGSQSVIGQVTARGKAVAASDTDADPIHRRNELLPHTRSELALPLRVGGRVIGALDIQSVKPSAFGEVDMSVFQTMADQLAIAIENARLFERAQRDLEDIELLNRQLTGEAWRKFISGRPSPVLVGYKSDALDVQPVTSGELDEAERVEADGTLSLPLTVRGETIGVLDLKPRSGEAPDEETESMLEAVAERVALALDGARLGEQVQRQAEFQELLSRLSAELQATPDLDVLLRTVVKETSKVLGTSRGFVHLAMEYGDAKDSEGEKQ